MSRNTFSQRFSIGDCGQTPLSSQPMSTTQTTNDKMDSEDSGITWDTLTDAQKTLIKEMSDVEKTAKELEEATGLSYFYTWQLLEDLRDKGLANRERNGRSYGYWLSHEGLVEFCKRGLVEPSSNALKDDEVFEAYHIGLDPHKGEEGELKLDIDEGETAANVSIERGRGSYTGPEKGIDLSMQHFSERPVKGSDEVTDEEIDEEVDALLQELDELEEEAEEEAFLTLELDEEEAFRIIAGEPLDKADRIALFDSLVSR